MPQPALYGAAVAGVNDRRKTPLSMCITTISVFGVRQALAAKVKNGYWPSSGVSFVTAVMRLRLGGASGGRHEKQTNC